MTYLKAIGFLSVMAFSLPALAGKTDLQTRFYLGGGLYGAHAITTNRALVELIVGYEMPLFHTEAVAVQWSGIYEFGRSGSKHRMGSFAATWKHFFHLNANAPFIVGEVGWGGSDAGDGSGNSAKGISYGIGLGARLLRWSIFAIEITARYTGNTAEVESGNPGAFGANLKLMY